MSLRELTTWCTVLVLTGGSCSGQVLPAYLSQVQIREPIVENLKVYVLQGQGAQNDTARGLAALTVVEVRDDNSKPVENAEVVFRLPNGGAGGVFAGQKQSFAARTNAQGQAEMKGFIPNAVPGTFEILVTATAGATMGQARIRQTNGTRLVSVVEPPKKRSFLYRWRWPIILAAAGGTGLGIWLGTRGGSSSTTTATPPTVLTPGPIVIGGPQ